MADAEEKAKAEKLAAAKKRVSMAVRATFDNISFLKPEYGLMLFAGRSSKEKVTKENHNEEGR